MGLTLNLYVSMLVCAVRSLAARFPEAKYTPQGRAGSCYYDRGKVENGPDLEGCIVGQANRELGLFAIPLPCFPASGGADYEIERAFKNATDEQKERAACGLRWIRYGLQAAQDQGQTWSEAIKTADFKYPKLDESLK